MKEFEPIDTKPKKKRKRGSNLGFIIIIIVLCLTLAGSLYVTFYSLKMYNKIHQEQLDAAREVTYTQEQLDTFIEEARAESQLITETRFKNELKDTAENNNGIVTMLRKLYPEYFVYYDSNHYVFVEIDESLPQANYTHDNLVANQGFMEYHQDGEVLSVKGIDVSAYQGDVDWEKVKESGVSFVMLRLGLRGYETGKLVLDDNFETNIQGALDAGLDVGVYFFTQAITDAEAREEAEFVCAALEPYQITYPVAIDVEDLYNERARSYGQSKESRTQCAITFMDCMKKAGYQTSIYGNLNTFTKLVDVNKLGDYEKWFAYYGDDIYYPYEINMWQYSDKGRVDGIEGDVDLNITFPVNKNN